MSLSELGTQMGEWPPCICDIGEPGLRQVEKPHCETRSNQLALQVSVSDRHRKSHRFKIEQSRLGTEVVWEVPTSKFLTQVQKLKQISQFIGSHDMAKQVREA